MGAAHAKDRHVSHRIITTDSEHPSVSEPIAYLESHGFEVVRLSTRGGVLDMQQLENALRGGALIMSVMLVNNETGARYDVERAFAMARRMCPDMVIHCDATQGYLKMPQNAARLGADMITVSAHKIHGPKGVGALCIAPEIIKTKRIIPFVRGGGQEKGFRSGTENVVGIVGFAAAVERAMTSFSADTALNSSRVSQPSLFITSCQNAPAFSGLEVRTSIVMHPLDITALLNKPSVNGL